MFSKNKQGALYKSCDQCKIKQKETRLNNKCEHGKFKYACRDCGTGICSHGKYQIQCLECKGSSVCEHNKQRWHCKQCISPIDVTIKLWLSNSKAYDSKRGLFNQELFISESFCKELVGFYKHCYHCSVELQYIVYRDDLSSIERLDNKQGHIMTNCVLCCLKCNTKKVSNRVQIATPASPV